MPIGFCVVRIAVVFPGGDFVDESLFVGDAAVQALGGQDTEFGFRQIEPTSVLGRVTPLEALDQAAGFGGRKGFGERSLAMDVEIVLDEDDGPRVGEVEIG